MSSAPRTPSVPAVAVTDLSHTYRNRQALKAVTFVVMPETIHGFVGPNGAGKTTTLKAISTLLQPTLGDVLVFGHNVRTEATTVRQLIGYMPDHFSMYRRMTVFEYLDFFAAAYGLPVKQRDTVIDDVLTLTDMAGRRNELISSLSRGMQQRVSLARVLVHDPDLLLLDEPASGLDPRARIELMEILRELRRMGKTIFISSHILSELAELCDSVTIVDHGLVRFSGPVHALLQTEQEQPSFVLQLSTPVPAALEQLTQLNVVTEATTTDQHQDREYILRTPDEVDLTTLLNAISSLQLPVVGISQQRRHLNQAFMDLTTRGID